MRRLKMGLQRGRERERVRERERKTERERERERERELLHVGVSAEKHSDLGVLENQKSVIKQ